MLSNHEICREIELGRDIRVDPYVSDLVGPSGLDVRLASAYRVPDASVTSLNLSSLAENHTHLEEASTGSIVLAPGAFALLSTIESIQLGSRVSGQIHAKSGLSRIGLVLTSGLIEPGYVGTLTLPVFNHGPWTITLPLEMRIATLSFWQSARAASSATYEGPYQGQQGPVESRFS